MTRLHPFDEVFGPVADEWFGTIRNVDQSESPDLAEFSRLAPVEVLLTTMQPETSDPEGADEYLRLLYAGYHFWKSGNRYLYHALPEHRYWAQVAEGAPHEPVDGFFIIPGREWVIVAVLGLRADRPGFSQVSVVASADDVANARSPRDQPFAPAMAGGDAAGFSSITSVAELLALARLALDSAQQ